MKNSAREILKKMAGFVLEMVELVYSGLMENEAHYLDRALNKEHIIDNLEKDVIAKIAGASKGGGEEEQKELILLGQIAQNIERMGDELRSLIERVEIKIAEGLYFSEMGINQYKDVFERTRESVKSMVSFLATNNADTRDDILKNGENIKRLIEDYRMQHMERLTKGICQPRASNIFFDMLDFTGNIARHCTNIARIHKER